MDEATTEGPLSEAKLLGILCHISIFMGVGVILPGLVYCLARPRGSAVSRHAREALNFHLCVVVYFLAALWFYAHFKGDALLEVLGLGVATLTALAGALYTSIACWLAAKGEFFHYPLTIRLL